jgi:hypothetical protein
MEVFLTSRVKRFHAPWTCGIPVHILLYGQFILASSTQNRPCLSLLSAPKKRSMVYCILMALIAGIICITAFEFYSNNILLTVIMLTTSILIYKHSFHFFSFSLFHHTYTPLISYVCFGIMLC